MKHDGRDVDYQFRWKPSIGCVEQQGRSPDAERDNVTRRRIPPQAGVELQE
jgi:hypothetical protein